MKKPTLRAEYLTELSGEQMRDLVGAEPQQVLDTISVNTCGCLSNFDVFASGCNISERSCGCVNCGIIQTI